MSLDFLSIDDEALLRLIAHGNTDALGALYDRYGRLVYTVALNTVGNQGTAEEITQDVFLRIWDHAGAYNAERGKVVTWITSIARHRAIDILRRRESRPESKSIYWDDLSLSEVPRHAGLEEKVYLSLRGQQIRSAIDQLPPEQKEVLALAYFKGYSHREIASALTLPLGTVKTRIRLAMQKLRKSLEDLVPSGG